MKQIVAIVKPFRAQAVLEALADLPLDSILVREAKGYGRQKDSLPRYMGSEYSTVYLPKIEITMLVTDEHVELVLDRVVQTARTGRIGDGKILLFSVAGDLDL